MSIPHELIIFVAAFVAGAINSVAGGGTLITFPVLVWLGRDPVLANATNAFALWPGSLAGAYGFRRELGNVRSWLLWFCPAVTLGSILGAWLLLRTSSETFSQIVPYLILLATLLVALQEPLMRWLGKSNTSLTAENFITAKPLAAALLSLFLIGIYGGYFGAGIGILTLGALGLLGLTDIHQMNGLKNFFATFINIVAAIYFAISGAVLWIDALWMGIGAIAGGYFGANLARKLGRKIVRRIVIAIGLLMSVSLFVFRG